MEKDAVKFSCLLLHVTVFFSSAKAQVLDEHNAWTLVTGGAGVGRAQYAVVCAREQRNQGSLPPLAGTGLPLVGQSVGVRRTKRYAEVSGVSTTGVHRAGCVRLVSH